MSLYFWWSAIGRADYPDFEWKLGAAEVDFIQKLDISVLTTEFGEAISYWLQGTGTIPGFELDGPLTDALYETQPFANGSELALPAFIELIVRARPDLTRHFDLSAFAGRIQIVDWWQKRGSSEYPRLQWSTGQVVNHLNELNDEQTYPGLRLPSFLARLISSRLDLARAYDLSNFAGLLSAMSWWDERGHVEYSLLSWQTDSVVVQLHLNESSDTETYPGLRLPGFVSKLIASRADLARTYDLSNFSSLLATTAWWDERGRFEYPALAWRTNNVLAQLGLNELEDRDVFPGLRVPRFLPSLIASREDLARSYDLSNFASLLAFLAWWEAHGSIEYPKLIWRTAEVHGYFSALQPLETDTAPFSTSSLNEVRVLMPRFFLLLVDSRPDLLQALDTKTFAGMMTCLDWWFRSGSAEYPHLAWDLLQTVEELGRVEPAQTSGLMRLPVFLKCLYESRSDLSDAYDLATNDGRRALIEWWQTHGRPSYAVLSAISVTVPRDIDVDVACDVQVARLGQAVPHGVNVVGFPQGVLGLGEDARTAAHALEQAAIPVVLMNAPMSGPAKLDMSYTRLLSGTLRYDTTLFCLPPPDMFRMALEGGRHLVESDTYKIGAWPWELPQWPNAFGQVHRFVDELWAQSRFVQGALSRQGETPVYHMPMAVEVPALVNPGRERFGLPEQSFLFYLMFDGNSWLSRKNPLAGIRAFQTAFAGRSEDVGLVIKAMNIREADPVWSEVRTIAAADSRIRVLTERLSRQDSIDFMASCDAYISLHRSEGFGRVIAEAMLLGQPVVVTNFSGNVDFCDEHTAFLVDGELVPLRLGDYLFHEGQYWCEADVTLAAGQLIRLVEDGAARQRIAAAGQRRIKSDYSTEVVSQAYARRLAAIHQGRVSQ